MKADMVAIHSERYSFILLEPNEIGCIEKFYHFSAWNCWLKRNADFRLFIFRFSSLAFRILKQEIRNAQCIQHINSERNAMHANHWFGIRIFGEWIFYPRNFLISRIMRLNFISSFQKFWMFIHISNRISFSLFLMKISFQFSLHLYWHCQLIIKGLYTKFIIPQTELRIAIANTRNLM